VGALNELQVKKKGRRGQYLRKKTLKSGGGKEKRQRETGVKKVKAATQEDQFLGRGHGNLIPKGNIKGKTKK